MAHLTPRQRAYIRKRTSHHDKDPSEEMGELNIVPFLDIVVNIIIFLLATVEAVLAMAQLEARLPSLGRRAGAAPEDEGSTLNLNVTVTQAGILVAGRNGKLAPGCASIQSGRVITVPRRTSGYDWAALTACVARIKAEPEFTDEHQVILSADPEIQFQHVIAAMDALRGDGTGDLFPDVLLSAGVR